MTRRGLFYALAVLLIAGTAGTAAFAPDAPPPEAVIAPSAAYERAESGDLALVDIRTPGEWEETGVAATAATANFNALSRAEFIARIEAIAEDGHNQAIALICSRGGRSSRALEILQEAGFSRVFDVHEGMLGNSAGPGWIERGLPTAEFR